MKRSRFSEEQIIGISDATFYTWGKKYGGGLAIVACPYF